MSNMDESAIYNKISHFFISLVVKFCKKSTVRELPTILCVSHMGKVTGNLAIHTSREKILLPIDKQNIRSKNYSSDRKIRRQKEKLTLPFPHFQLF